MKQVLLGENLSGVKVYLNLQELITGRTLLCCISRWGKTWTARRIIEQVFGKTGIIIVDVEGEYATLRDKYPLLIIGKDIPLVPESAEFLADQIIEHDLSAIIDGSDPELDIAAFQEFLARFIDRFIAVETKARKPYLWILEEADELAPETGIARSICLNQIRKLVKKGGKRGLGTLILTQRPAFVSKFVISQCLPPDEPIITSAGLRRIDEVRVGDKVLTHRGRFRSVTKIFTRYYEGKLVEVRTKGWNQPIRLTPEHPTLVMNKQNRWCGHSITQKLRTMQWISAGNLSYKQYLVFPRISESFETPLVKMKYNYMNRGGRTPRACNKDRIVPVDSNLLQVIGYYIAEGSIRKFNHAPTAASVRWSFGKTEREHQLAKSVQQSLLTLGFNASVRRTQGLWECQACSTALANWLIENFGRGASKKRIPTWIKQLPATKLGILIESYVNGDGHRVPDRIGQLNATTVSEQLAYDLRDIALKVGRRAYVYKHCGKSNIGVRSVKARDVFSVNISPTNVNPHGSTPFDDQAIYLKVTALKHHPYSGIVYNLEVEEDNSFCTRYQALHNCPNKLIGRTEWPEDLAVLRKFGRIPKRLADPESKDLHAIKNLEKGQFHTSGDFIDKDEIVKVGPVITEHLGATPELVPPAPKELKNVLAQLSQKLPAIIQEKLAPAVPKVAEIETRIKKKFEAQWQARLTRKDKELSSIKNRLEAKYETEIADLKRKLDEAVRHATLRGGISDLLSHPLIKKNLSKLNAKQRGFVELLETKGPQDSEHCSLFLEIKPKSVPVFVHEVNRKIPKLIENVRGRYASRLVKLFPVTDEAKVEAKETEQLRSQVVALQRQLDEAKSRDRLKNEELDGIRKLLRELQATSKVEKPSVPSAENVVQPGQGPVIPVDVTLRRKLADFKVEVDREVLNVDESSWEGKILARGLDGFFNEPKGIGKIMAELVRRYGVGDSGGNRTTLGTRLTMLVSKGILDRKQDGKQWVYSATPEFRDRVKGAK